MSLVGRTPARAVRGWLRHPLRWWDAAVVAVVLVLAVITGWEPARLGADRVPTLIALLLLVIVYLVLGRAALRRAVAERPATPATALFLALLGAVIAAASAAMPTLASLQVLGYPMIWVLVSGYRSAVLASAALAAATGVGLGIAYVRAGVEPMWPAATVAVLSFAFAVAMGTWITRIFDEGERHRELAERLRSAQDEVAALSQAAGAAEERERLSRELHDTLTQTLTGLVMLAEQAGRALDAGETGRGRERLGRVEAAARAAVGEARALVAATHPLGDGGVERAIERVAASLRHDAGLRVNCEFARVPLDREVQVVLLRAAQEGLANARRHSAASEVTVRLRSEGTGADRLAVLEVDDNGAGVPAAAGAAASGFGLAGLRDRVRLVGGEVALQSRPGGGARLQVRVPHAEGAVAGARG